MQAKIKTPTFRLNNFELQLIFNESHLIIKAECKSSPKKFQTTIKSEHVKEQTLNIFSDAEFLYLGLLDTLENKDPNATVSFSEDGKLIYSLTKTIRDKTRTEQFTLQLPSVEEENIDDVTRLNKEVEYRLKKVEQQEKKIEELEREKRNMKSDAEQALLEKLEAMDNEKIPQMKEDFNKRLNRIEMELVPLINETMMKALLNLERTVYQKIEDADKARRLFNQEILQTLGITENGTIIDRNQAQHSSAELGNGSLTHIVRMQIVISFLTQTKVLNI